MLVRSDSTYGTRKLIGFGADRLQALFNTRERQQKQNTGSIRQQRAETTPDLLYRLVGVFVELATRMYAGLAWACHPPTQSYDGTMIE